MIVVKTLLLCQPTWRIICYYLSIIIYFHSIKTVFKLFSNFYFDVFSICFLYNLLFLKCVLQEFVHLIHLLVCITCYLHVFDYILVPDWIFSFINMSRQTLIALSIGSDLYGFDSICVGLT